MSQANTEMPEEPVLEGENIANEASPTEEATANVEMPELPVEEKSPVAALEEEVTDLKDKYLRLYSEFDNYRKRVLKEKNEIKTLAMADVMSKLLEVVDDFDRTQKAMEHTTDIAVIKEGMVLIFSKMNKVLEQQGLKNMVTIGEAFNPDLHESIASIPAADESLKGKIIDEVQRGYYLHDKPIRFAKVVIGA
jgi:molecular chaperone GrpE